MVNPVINLTTSQAVAISRAVCDWGKMLVSDLAAVTEIPEDSRGAWFIAPATQMGIFWHVKFYITEKVLQ